MIEPVRSTVKSSVSPEPPSRTVPPPRSSTGWITSKSDEVEKIANVLSGSRSSPISDSPSFLTRALTVQSFVCRTVAVGTDAITLVMTRSAGV